MAISNWKIGGSLCVAAFVLAGCESGTGFDDSATVDDYNAQAIAYNDLRAEVQAMRPSTAADMPTVGSASYAGLATVLVDTPTDSALVGDAWLTADFSNSTIRGNLTDFVGTVNGSDYANYSGSLGITNGEIGIASANALAADLSGTLTSNTDRLTVNGGVRGNFRSDGPINAAGLTAAETADTDFIVNGRGYDGDIGIVAER
jgi:hypothetical protein